MQTLQGTKLLISPSPIPTQQFDALLPLNQVTSLEPATSLQLFQFPSPLLGFLVAHSPASQLQLELQLLLKGQKISYRLVSEASTPGHLYKLIQIDSCQCYQKPICCTITLRAIIREQSEPSSLEQLVHDLSCRSYSLANNKPVHTLKRDLVVKQPIHTLYRYCPQGYLWLKCTNVTTQVVIIDKVELVNWLAKGQDQVRNFKSRSTLTQQIELEKGESVAVMLSTCGSLEGVEVPYVVEYQLRGLEGCRFRMMKYLYIQ